jgi:hypothetical protein
VTRPWAESTTPGGHERGHENRSGASLRTETAYDLRSRLRESNPRPTHYENVCLRERHAQCVHRCTSRVTPRTAARFDRPCFVPRLVPRGPSAQRPDGPSRLGSSALAAGDVSLLASVLGLLVTRGRGTPARAGARRPGPASRQVRRSARSGRVIAGRSVQSRSARGRWSSPWRGRRGRRRRRRAGPRRPGPQVVGTVSAPQRVTIRSVGNAPVDLARASWAPESAFAIFPSALTMNVGRFRDTPS